jgi:hypothetical protein
MLPNSFVPSIEIVHSIAITTSATKEMVMDRLALTNRAALTAEKLPVSGATDARVETFGRIDVDGVTNLLAAGMLPHRGKPRPSLRLFGSWKAFRSWSHAFRPPSNKAKESHAKATILRELLSLVDKGFVR